MDKINKNVELKKIHMPKECALAFNTCILKYINIPCLDQVIMLPGDNDTPLPMEYFIILLNSLPLKYIYSSYLSEIVSYEEVSNMDFFTILNYETIPNELSYITLEWFKFYVIDKDTVKEVVLPKNYKNKLFGVIPPSNIPKRVRAIAFSSLFKYNNNIFMNDIFNIFRNKMNDDEFSTFMEDKYKNALRYIQNKNYINLFNTCADFWAENVLEVSYQNYSDLDLTTQYNIILKQIVNFIKQKVNSLDPILKKAIYEASGVTCPTINTRIDKPLDIAPLIKQINNLPETLLK